MGSPETITKKDKKNLQKRLSSWAACFFSLLVWMNTATAWPC
jgi:hypothetical protein